MPFTPLPKIFTDLLANLDPKTDVVVELGSGEGQFRALLPPEITHVGLDLRHPLTGAVCDLVGDARKPPVMPGSAAVVVAANLARHINPRRDLGATVDRWRGLVKPGGSLFVFEDEPGQDTRAQRNYRDLQDFMARLMPESRGALMPLRRFRELVGADPRPAGWVFGSESNGDQINAAAVVQFLKTGAGRPSAALQSLMDSVAGDGIAPGRYWWAMSGPASELGAAVDPDSERGEIDND